jgi:ADP-heptose:LPS heptosyltransferase
LRDAWPADAPRLDGAELVVVHVGAQLPSRRWSPLRFAQVADRLASEGRTVVLPGAASETELVAAVQRVMHQRAVNLAGRTSLWSLGALIDQARLVVCNDTGVSHIAAALHTPSVVVSCGAEVARWAPLDAALHPAAFKLTREYLRQETAAKVLAGLELDAGSFVVNA